MKPEVPMTSSIWHGWVPEKPISIGLHGEDFYPVDRKRRVDDVIIIAALDARILGGLNAV